MSRRPDRKRHHLAALTALVLSLLALPVRADSGLLNGSLGRWLDTEVLPELGRTLGEHPRFKGETIKLVSLAGGRPTDRASRLHEAVQAHLTQRLLRSSGVRIAWTDQPLKACGVTAQADYLLGIEIERDDSRYHRLNIRMIDVAEAIWVSGVSHAWQGRLTATEAAALRQPVSPAPRGTVDSPLPAASTSEIASTMHQHLRCAHPEGLDGPLYLEPADSVELNRVLASLTSQLATAPLAAVTGSAEEADWVLTLEARDAVASASAKQVVELDLMLTEQNGGITQQVATVFVSGAGRVVRTPPPATRIAGMLSDMRLAPAATEGICDTRKARSNQCAEVSFELYEDAYLFVLSSSNRTLSTEACDSRMVTASPGERRFRIRVPPSTSSLPDAGVYAIAVSDREAARAFSRHIRQGVCSRPLNRSERWLAELDALLAEHAGAVEWRAIHLSHSPSGVTRL